MIIKYTPKITIIYTSSNDTILVKKTPYPAFDLVNEKLLND